MSPFWQGMIFGLLVAVLLIGLDRIGIYFGLTEAKRVIDDLAGGVIAGLIAYWQARNRERFLEQRLRVIALMNHHVRNALQVITYSHYLKPEERQVEQVKEAVERIEWALREVLPASSLGKAGESSNGAENLPAGSAVNQR